jgi:hypothetical protein
LGEASVRLPAHRRSELASVESIPGQALDDHWRTGNVAAARQTSWRQASVVDAEFVPVGGVRKEIRDGTRSSE